MEKRYYRHFKGNYYEVLFEAKHTESGEELVIYRALYGEGKMWARPKEMFYGRVQKDGYEGLRYVPVSIEDVRQNVDECYMDATTVK